MKRGYISAYFESGNTNRSVQTISYNPSDPGGKSYGKYQLSSRAGTLRKYIAWSKFNDKFKDTFLASTDFDKVWVELSNDPEFEQEQQEYIELTHYKPVKQYAKLLGFDTDNEAIQEALFSIGVQHGGYKKILINTANFRTSSKPDVIEDLENLYKARSQYVSNLGLSPAMKKALYNRYEKELKMIISLASPDASQYEKRDSELHNYTDDDQLLTIA